MYIYALWGQHRPLHLISNDKSSAVVDYLNGFRICDRWGKKEKRSQDGVPRSQRGDLTYMSLLDLVAGAAGSSNTMAA